jgi:tetratricopeptide (TPR) repeat protein
LAEDPENQKAHEYMAWVLAGQGRLKEAVNGVDNAIRLGPQNAHPYYVKATCYANNSQYQKSLRWFRQAIRLDPETYFYHSRYSEVLYSLGRYQDALRAAKKGLKLNPQSMECHNALTKALKGLKRNREAFLNVEKTLALNPENAEALHLKGQFLLEDLELKEAEEAIQESLRIQPVNWKAERDLGTIRGQKIYRWPAFIGFFCLLSVAFTQNAASVIGGFLLFLSVDFCERLGASSGRYRTAMIGFTPFLILLWALDVAFFYNAHPWYHDWGAWALGLFFIFVCVDFDLVGEYFDEKQGINLIPVLKTLLIVIFLPSFFSSSPAGIVLSFNGLLMLHMLKNLEKTGYNSWFGFWTVRRVGWFSIVVFTGCFAIGIWQERFDWASILCVEALFIFGALIPPEDKPPLKEEKISQAVETKSLSGGNHG